MIKCEPVMINCEDLQVIDGIIQKSCSLDIHDRKHRKQLIENRKKLFHALVETISEDDEKCDPALSGPLDCAKCGTKMVWEHPHIPYLLMESSCFIGADICHDCLSEHCETTPCDNCERRPQVGKCNYLYMKPDSVAEKAPMPRDATID